MTTVLLIGNNELTYKLLENFHKQSNLQIIAMEQAGRNFKPFLNHHPNIKIVNDVNQLVTMEIDYVFFTEDNSNLKLYLKEQLQEATFVAYPLLRMFYSVLFGKSHTLNKFANNYEGINVVLNSIRDGIIVIDKHSHIVYLNKTAKTILDVKQTNIIGAPVKSVIPHSRLPNVLQTQVKEVNQTFQINESKQIITTRIPLLNDKNYLIGAFAIFKDRDEVVELAEQNTNLKQIKMMFETVINSTEEAISVVDDLGNVIIINSVFTQLTHLSEKDIIGKNITNYHLNIHTIHQKVLKTRRPIKRHKIIIENSKKEVSVNAIPIFVSGKLKGSIAIMRDLSEIKEITSELQLTKRVIRYLESNYTFADIVGTSTDLKIAIEQAKVGARSPVPILLKSDEGTEKEVFARAIHNESDRKHNKFIHVDCANISKEYMEQAFFGYENDLSQTFGPIGYFEQAHSGTLFVDNIHLLTYKVQEKIFSTLETEIIHRVSSSEPIRVNVKIIATTNINLERLVNEQKFSKKLYYRLNRIPIYIPHLTERKEDITLLINDLLMKRNQFYGKQITQIDAAAEKVLKNYDWPKNLKELEHVVDHVLLYIDIDETTIQKHHLPPFVFKTQEQEEKNDEPVHLQVAVDEFEKQFISEIYSKNEYNKAKTAKQLNISLRSLYYKIEKYGLDK